MDYNNTIEDIVLKRRGTKLFQALNRLSSISKSVGIVLITKAGDNIDDDILELLHYMPAHLRQMVKGIVKYGGKTFQALEFNQNGIFFLGNPQNLGGTTKRDGIELSKPIVDPKDECNLLICAGDNVQDDLPMLDANVKAQKYLILANERKNLPQIENMIKTTKHSYGVATALNKICDDLQNQQSLENDNVEHL